MKTFFKKKSLEPRLSNYKDYYYKYKALKYYFKNNSIEKQKQIKGGADDGLNNLPPPPQLVRNGTFRRYNVIIREVEEAINTLKLNNVNDLNNENVVKQLLEYIEKCNNIIRTHNNNVEAGEAVKLVTYEEFLERMEKKIQEKNEIMKYYLKNNSIETQKQIKGGTIGNFKEVPIEIDIERLNNLFSSKFGDNLEDLNTNVNNLKTNVHNLTNKIALLSKLIEYYESQNTEKFYQFFINDKPKNLNLILQFFKYDLNTPLLEVRKIFSYFNMLQQIKNKSELYDFSEVIDNLIPTLWSRI